MTSRARDVRYGRRGGGWVDGDGTTPSPPVPCDVCGGLVHTGTRHASCIPDTDDDTQMELEL